VGYEVRGLSKSYGELRVLGGLDLEFPAGRVTVVLGPSGCGKTSLLNILAGLDSEYSGELLGFGPGKASYVFQEDRLMPWMSAMDNVAFVLKRFMDRDRALATAEDALAAVGLHGSRGSKPGAMSGGMRRRVALARAFAYPSEVLLLDEPFSSLDLRTRISVMDLFLDLRERDGRSAVVVTHDVREAIYLGSRIATLSDKPATARDVFDLTLAREDRGFARGAAASFEARQYESILS
jgi:NitT/TauT family transport system ATP-binding protein